MVYGYNILGELVFYSENKNHDQCKIDLSRLERGFYLVKIADGKESITQNFSVI